ncbi:MAG: bifunctional UDP-sugar hydrolase/5'-nucleotidase [Anaerolineae bacterium]
MRKLLLLTASFIFAILLVACGSDLVVAPTEPSNEPTNAPALRSTPVRETPESDNATSESADPEVATNEPTSPTSDETEFPKQVLILYTNDEHGWMEGVDEGLGASNLVGTWHENHDFEEYDAVIRLSGGDMWTGPAISTWFEGESMVEVLNLMDYSAAAVGNHEFDFGLTKLTENGLNSTFPFVSANIRWKDSGETPTDLNIWPYVIQEVGGIRVGITGLTTTSTPRTTNPANVRELDFLNYEQSLREIIPQIVAEDVDLILVPGHVCLNELQILARQIEDLPIDLLGGGHCNELYADTVRDTAVVIGGSHLAAYAWADLTVDEGGNTTNAIGFEWTNDDAEPDAEIDQAVSRWMAEADKALNKKIGELAKPLQRRGIEQQALITESWLWWFPSADIALTNLGGFRADLTAGDVTQGTIINVFPFSNVVVEVDLTGQEVLRILGRRSNDLAIGGVELSGGQWRFKSTGAEIDTAETYTVLVNDFMFAGGDGYEMLAEQDPDGYNTAVDWRQPLIDWISDEGAPGLTLEERIEDLIEKGG